MKFYRIIYSRCPSVELYEGIAEENNYDILNDIEALTNPRAREANGITDMIPEEDRYSGKHQALVYAPFLHISKDKPSRFSDGSFGVFYCADSEECAIEETKYHSLKFYEATGEENAVAQMRLLVGELDDSGLDDITSAENPDLYNTIDYTESQKYGLQIKNAGGDGIKYRSVRRQNSVCCAVFKPKIIKNIKDKKFYEYILKDGKIEVKNIIC